MSVLYFPCEISLYRRNNFSLWFAFMHVPGMQGIFSILMSLHFVRISDAKVIASRFPTAILNARNDGFASKILKEEETGLNTVVYAKGRTKQENKHIKYNLTLYFGTSD